MVSFGAERLGSGATVGGFRLVDSIGDGPLGAVWTAVDRERDRGAAVKVIHRPIAHDPAFRRLVEGGGPAVRRDRHRGILATWETGDVERGVYIAMPLCDPHLGAA
ncbi:MAG: hypothetical protein ACR2L8_13640, partial [Solirubrobacteraceae bacterium]